MATCGQDKVKRLYTLAFLLDPNDNSKILLGMKKRGLGEGKWNGFGGKVEKGEQIPQAAIREIEEECGLVVQPSDLVQAGINIFEFVGNNLHFEVHVFITDKFTGMLRESEEMRPQWFSVDDLPYAKMWPDDELWVPIMLKHFTEVKANKKQKYFDTFFLFEGFERYVEHKVEVVDEIRWRN